MPFAAPGLSWGYITGNALTTRPSATIGTAITPGTSNSYGSYTEVLTSSDVAEDLYGLWILAHAGNFSGEARDTIATVGVDPAGGTSYTDVISHLLVSCAASLDSGPGIYYYFPLWVKAGSSVAVKASVNSANARTIRFVMQGFGRPSDQRLVKCGTRVETVGAVTASSCGTTVTSGTTNEGSWTDLGALSNDAWWFECGFGVNDSTLSTGRYHMDLAAGDASNKDVLIQDIAISASNVEQVGKPEHFGPKGRPVKAGEHLYGRLQCISTPDSSLSMAAYAVS